MVTGFPAKGLLPTAGILICAVLTLWIAVGQLGFDPGTVSVFTLFATWFAFIVSMAGGWPISKVSQPARGFLFILVCLGYGLLHMWAQPNVFGIPATYFWPAIANLFLAIGITIALDNKFVEGLKQPAAIIMNVLFWYLFAYLLMHVVTENGGMVPAIWFAWFLFYFFWMDRYPIANLPQPAKGILSMCVLAACGILLNDLFIWFFHTNFFQPDAGSWFASWVFWLVISSWVFDTWPFQSLKQPAKAGVGLVLTAVLASITYYVIAFVAKIPLGDAVGYLWIFICWGYIWAICLGKWPYAEQVAPVPAQAPAPA